MASSATSGRYVVLRRPVLALAYTHGSCFSQRLHS